ncbi:MAG: glycoside hydrolase family 95 protein, partial [Candidatus Brocadiaceae bacterium]
MNSPLRAACVLLAIALAAGPALAQPDPDADWRLVQVPAEWGTIGGDLADYDGFAWCRCFIQVPAEWDGEELTLALGKIDDADEAFLNGVRIGGTGGMPPNYQTGWQTVRRYTVAPEHVRFGGYNLIAVRVYDGGGGGGMISGDLALHGPKAFLSLTGKWQLRIGDDPSWANWPADPATPEGEKVAQEYQDASDSAVGQFQKPPPVPAGPPEGDLTLWYRQPAEKWTEALAIGNGRLGAMVFGRIDTERIQLNEDSLWTGEPIDRDKPDAAKHLAEARRLLFAGKYVEGQKYVQDNIMGRRIDKGIHTYQTLGDLELSFEEQTDVSEYRRDLDLDSAIARVSYRAGDAAFTREAFSSAPDRVIVVRLDCDTPDMLTFGVTLSRPADAEVRVV